MSHKEEIKMEENQLSMPTKYDPQSIEKGRYQWWLEGKFFETTGDEQKEPYTIVIPPPNVTGKLHLGHAWDTTLQDILTRMKRMQGRMCFGCQGWTMPELRHKRR